jgi:hypothetical protein
MGQRVKRVRTTVSDSELANTMVKAWEELFSTTPSKEQINMLMAHNALETGHRKSMWNYNIGNITTDGKGSFNYFDDLTTDEQIKPGKWEKRNLKYRAYPNLLEGVKDYLKLLSNAKYANAWKHILNPDIAAFSKGLKESRYYTANEAPYTKYLTTIYNQLAKKDLPLETSTKNVSNKDFQYYEDELSSVLNQYLQMVAASEKSNKQLYKKYLPHHNFSIKITSNNICDSSEYARVLSAVLEEELLASTAIYHQDNQVEVECKIMGPKPQCFQAVAQINELLTDTFKQATQKIGSPYISAQVINKRAAHQLLDPAVAYEYHLQFLSKFKEYP